MISENSLLPQLPFPSRINPFTPQLEMHLEQLSADLKLYDIDSLARWRAAAFHRLTGRMYPSAAESHLAAIGEVVLWLFIVDDYLDPGMPGSDIQYRSELPHKIEQLLAGEPSGVTCGDPLLECARRFSASLGPLASPHWWKRFAIHLLQFVESIRREASVHAAGVSPDRSTYLAHRQSTSGWQLLVDLVELEGQVELPDAFIESESRVSWCMAAADVACGINDILSLSKELSAGEQHNLVLILQREHDCPLAEALAHARVWIDARLEEYFTARLNLLDQHAHVPGITTYVQGVENLMRGSVDWSMDTGRYRPPAAGELGVRGAAHHAGGLR